jgi:carbon-monoxide dehydrogenase medium subunit
MERWIANVRVRSTGTIGGNLCFAEPHSDPATFFNAWGAELELARGEARRRRPAEGFVTGALETDRADDELLVAIHLPRLAPNTAVVHRKVQLIQRPAASVAVRLGVGDGRFSSVRVAVGSVGEIPGADAEAAAVVEGAGVDAASRVFAEAGRIAAANADPYEDLNGSVRYKRQLVSVLVRRAFETAYAEVQTHA